MQLMPEYVSRENEKLADNTFIFSGWLIGCHLGAICTNKYMNQESMNVHPSILPIFLYKIPFVQGANWFDRKLEPMPFIANLSNSYLKITTWGATRRVTPLVLPTTQERASSCR